MTRKIIEIDEVLCNGCGLCADACHEAAIIIEGGKARLLADNYCDGLGNCLPACPVNAITFIERVADDYDENAVMLRLASLKASAQKNEKMSEELSNWPVQIKLAPATAPAFKDAHLLIAADCAAFAYVNFNKDLISGKTTLIGCPKLDSCDYSDKLSEIFVTNNIKSITVARMEVPCCGGLDFAVKTAINKSKKNIPVETFIISTKGKIL